MTQNRYERAWSGPALPSAAEALERAYGCLQLGETEAADTWIFLAKELREGSQLRPAIIVGDNVDPETAHVFAELGRDVERWKQRAHEQRAEAERWRGAYEALVRQAADAEARKLDSDDENLADYYGTTGAELHPVSAPIYSGLATGGIVRRPEQDLGDRVAQIVSEATAVFPTDAARRLRATEMKLPVPAEPRPGDVRFGDTPTTQHPTIVAAESAAAGPLPELRDSVCPNCDGETYEAITAGGKEARHRETGTTHCPVR